MQNKLSPLQVLAACLALSSVGGLAALLRSGVKLTWRAIFSAVLYSGVFGLVYGLIWFNYFDGKDQNFYFLIGSSGLIGLGGTTLLDFLVQVATKGGLKIVVTPKEETPPETPQPPQGGEGENND